MRNNVRLFKIDEISFDSSNDLHLPNVENAISSMRGAGHSLVFLVQGDSIKTSVYMGISRFREDAVEINSSLESYTSAWMANFPGSKITKMTTEEVSDISFNLAECKEFGVLTGIPSLKRKEDTHVFVQGLERLIRAMRGKIYCWMSIADPIPVEDIRNAIDACQRIQSDVHHLVKTTLNKSTSSGKTIMLGMFGMLGQTETEGTAKTLSETLTKGNSTASTHTVGGSATAGFCGSGVSANYSYANTHSTFESLAKGVANSINQAISQQLGGGGFKFVPYVLPETFGL